jgi:hypothetical protein
MALHEIAAGRVSVDQAAKWLGISRAHMYNLKNGSPAPQSPTSKLKEATDLLRVAFNTHQLPHNVAMAVAMFLVNCTSTATRTASSLSD